MNRLSRSGALLATAALAVLATATGLTQGAAGASKTLTAEKIKELIVANASTRYLRPHTVLTASETSDGARIDSRCIPGRAGIDLYIDVSEGRVKMTDCNHRSWRGGVPPRDFQAEIDRIGNRVAKAANVGKYEHGSTWKVRATRRKAVIRFDAPDTVTDRSVKALKVNKRGKITAVNYRT